MGDKSIASLMHSYLKTPYIMGYIHTYIYTYIHTFIRSLHTYTYSMAQQPSKSFERPLMTVSLSNSILFKLIFY